MLFRLLLDGKALILNCVARGRRLCVHPLDLGADLRAKGLSSVEDLVALGELRDVRTICPPKEFVEVDDTVPTSARCGIVTSGEASVSGVPILR